MRTKEVLKKLTTIMEMRVNGFKGLYNREDIKGKMKDAIRAEMSAYLLGLRDAGFITDRERQILFCYMTI